MSGSPGRTSRDVHAELAHPVVDCDGHWFEPLPVLLDFLRDAGGPELVEWYSQSRRTSMAHSGANWYGSTPEERLARRLPRGGWWGQPTDTRDRATAMLPPLLAERLGEMGIDFAIVYPTVGLAGINFPREEQRRAYCRAYNTMCAELFGPLADRLTPVATVPTHTPSEAIDTLEHAVLELGLKVIVINGAVKRPIPALATDPHDVRTQPYFVDHLGLDSAHDYDPFWQRCVDLGVAVTTHSGTNGLPDRMSTSNWQCNHLGHFAQANHAFARSLFMGGVTNRFPDLRFAFLEGGAGWACSLYLDLIGHWSKRAAHHIASYDPRNVDLDEMRRLVVRHGGPRIADRADEVMANLDSHNPGMSLQELGEREPMLDEFAATGVTSVADLADRFLRPFFVGCEGEDRTTAWAFAPNRLAPVQPVFSSDISHWDVTDMSEVLAESWELVDEGLLTTDDFRRFTFEHAVRLHGGMNPAFFDGTAVEKEARALL